MAILSRPQCVKRSLGRISYFVTASRYERPWYCAIIRSRKLPMPVKRWDLFRLPFKLVTYFRGLPGAILSVVCKWFQSWRRHSMVKVSALLGLCECLFVVTLNALFNKQVGFSWFIFMTSWLSRDSIVALIPYTAIKHYLKVLNFNDFFTIQTVAHRLILNTVNDKRTTSICRILMKLNKLSLNQGPDSI